MQNCPFWLVPAPAQSAQSYTPWSRKLHLAQGIVSVITVLRQQLHLFRIADHPPTDLRVASLMQFMDNYSETTSK